MLRVCVLALVLLAVTTVGALLNACHGMLLLSSSSRSYSHTQNIAYIRTHRTERIDVYGGASNDANGSAKGIKSTFNFVVQSIPNVFWLP